MTRGAWLALPLLLLAVLPQPARAADAIRVDLVATEVDGVPTFTDASGVANPTLHATPGAHLTIHLVNRGALRHNLVLDAPVRAATACCLAPGQEANLTVDLPAGFTGQIVYECAIHGGGGMRGALLVGAPPPSVRLVSPVNGTTLHGPPVAQVEVGNATLGQGYALRYVVDGALLPNATGATQPLGDLPRGSHIVQVELVNATGESLTPPVKTEAIFFEEPTPIPTPTPEPTTATPPASSTPAKTPLPAGLVFAAVAIALLVRRSR